MRDLIVFALCLSAASFVAVRGQIVTAKGCCVAIAIDESTSLTDPQFAVMTKFVADIINGFPNYGGVNGQTAAVCKFSTRVTDIFGLRTYGTNKAGAVTAVNNLLLNGGNTNTHLAINKLGDYLRECNSTYNKFSNLLGIGTKMYSTILQAGLVITDGNSNFPALTSVAARSFKNRNALLIVVGIGTNINTTQLEAIASPRSYYSVIDFASLNNIRARLERELCTEIKTTPQPRSTDLPCLKCEFINGLYLFRNRRYCYVFHQCLSYTQAVPFERPCPFGQFFERQSATCKPANEVDCPDDPCKDTNVQSYPNHRVCSAYFTCANGRTQTEMCCAAGQRFVAGSGCVTDATCTTPCRPVPKKPLCLSRPDPNDVTKYQVNTAVDVWITRSCAPGTNFVADKCECSKTVPAVPDPACEHELYLPFNTNVQDYQYRRYVTNNDPKVQIVSATGAVGGNAAQFGGSSRLLVKSYDNAWFGKELVIRTRFRESDSSSPPAGRTEAIFGNGDCTRKGSVEVGYDRSTNRVTARLVTYDENMKEVVTTTSVAPVSRGAWKDVEFRYDGSKLQLTVDNAVESADATGNIATRHAALQIGGGCLNNEFLHGLQDEFYVYPCLP